MNRFLQFVAAAGILGGLLHLLGMVVSPAYASSIKSWTTGERIKATDINANFAHLHGTMVGGHGTRLVDADVSSSAAIAHSKMATPALLPKVWAVVKATCTSSPCTIAANSGVSSITRASAGSYSVIPSSARADTSYGVIVTPVNPASAIAANAPTCYIEPLISTTSFSVDCFENDFGAGADTGFTVMVLDNDN